MGYIPWTHLIFTFCTLILLSLIALQPIMLAHTFATGDTLEFVVSVTVSMPVAANCRCKDNLLSYMQARRRICKFVAE
jgi:hypothetical protein